jgi:hypothetical protein
MFNVLMCLRSFDVCGEKAFSMVIDSIYQRFKFHSVNERSAPQRVEPFG